MKTLTAAIALSVGLAAWPAMGCPTVRGTIGTNTTESFDRLMQDQPFRCLMLNSRGGSVVEAEKIAGLIHRNHVEVEVPDGGMCASACFLLFAAGERRWIGGPNVRIGVHSVANPEGEETGVSFALDTLMARDLAEYGVPDAIIGKLIRTPNSDITWLTVDDLADMNVAMDTGQQQPTPPAEAPLPGDGVETGPGATAPAPLVPTTPTSAAYDDGKRDRVALEQWVHTLGGDAYIGAQYWASVRSHNPVPCDAVVGMSAQWIAGCNAARVRFAPLDARRHNEPDYRAGWNAASAQLAGG
jgi:hypothetical protein